MSCKEGYADGLLCAFTKTESMCLQALNCLLQLSNVKYNTGTDKDYDLIRPVERVDNDG